MNVSFSEIILILLIAFLVIKPERLPEVARAIGRWINMIRNIFSRIKNEITQPVEKNDG